MLVNEQREIYSFSFKYRPDSWETIVGQDNIAKTLKQAIDTDQLAQAYLFCGPRGVGKTSTARLFAKAINLKHNDPELTDFSYIYMSLMLRQIIK